MSSASGTGQVHHILFLCLGNICRSPAAEGIFKAYVDELGVADSYKIDSAGTGDYHLGKSPDARMLAACKTRGYELTSRGRQVEPADFERFDHIIAMDRRNVENVLLLEPTAEQRKKMKLLSDFLGDDSRTDVPDPYHGGEDGFYFVIDMIKAACPEIDRRIRTPF